MCSRLVFLHRIWNKYKPKLNINKKDTETSESIHCLWPIFRWARIFGLCPVARVGNNIIVHKYYHINWCTTWLAVTINTFMIVNTLATSIPLQSDTISILGNINSVTYYAQILFASVYMAVIAKQIPIFLDRCIKVENICKSYVNEEKKTTGLMRDTFILFISFTTAQISGTVIYHLALASTQESESFSDYMNYYKDSYAFIKGDKAVGFSYFLILIFIDWGWHFPELLLAMFSLILGRLFARINRVLVKTQSFSLAELEKLRCDHREICQLVRACNNIFSPLFFMMYVGNVIYLFTRLYTALGDDLRDSKQIVQLEALYAFAYLIFIKIILPTYLAARLHEQAHECIDIIHSWPSETNVPDANTKLLVMSRFVSHLTTGDIAINGCNFFTITKKFLVTLIGALITYEVIVLQFQLRN